MSEVKERQKVYCHFKQKQPCSLCKINDREDTGLFYSKRFKSVVSSRIRSMIEDDTSTDEIRHELIKSFPEHKNYFTNRLICSHIKTESGILSSLELEQQQQPNKRHDEMAIEFEHSVFVDEADIVFFNEGQCLKVNMICAVTYKGLKRISVCLKKRQCAHHFTRSMLKKYTKKGIPVQVVVIGKRFPDLAEVESLFLSRLTMHSLIHYPIDTKVSHPASKYIRKLVAHMPKKFQVEDIQSLLEQAETNISKSQCQKWIRKVIKRDCV